MGWLAGLLAFVLAGGIAFIESASVFLDAPDTWRICKVRVIGGAALMGLFAAACYGVLLLLQYPVQLSFAGHAPHELVVALFAVGVIQILGRVEAPKKTVINGSPQIAGDRESFYTKVSRWIHVHIYRKLLRGLPDTDAATLVLRGLAAAYDFEAMLREFEDWASLLPDRARSEELLAWAGTVSVTHTFGERKKRDTLLRRLVLEDLPAARKLALQRATAIVDQRAL